ncbi:MAG: HNH endonuclease [Frankia sp.]|nr:HNH endonuclease [Frankia sp.]
MEVRGVARRKKNQLPARIAGLVLVIAVALLAYLLADRDGSPLDDIIGDGGTATTEPSVGAGAGEPGSALAALDALPVQEPIESPPYERDEFGAAWADVDDNGCDTRNDILQRDLRSTTLGQDGCTVLTGELTDPYTTRIIRFDRERNASAVQIDHVVSLSDAWQTGAYAWTDERREAFANDPENLLAVDGPTNVSKSDKNAAEWLPPADSYHCPLVARQVGLKTRYGLWVTPEEAEAMRRVLTTCPDQPVLGGAGPSQP